MSCSVCHTTEVASLLILTPCEHILCKECHLSPLVLLSCFGCPCCGSFPEETKAVQKDADNEQEQENDCTCDHNTTASTSSSSSSNCNGLSSSASVSSIADLAPVMSARRRRFLNRKAAATTTSLSSSSAVAASDDMYLHMHGRVEYFEESSSSSEEEQAVVEDEESSNDEGEEWPSPFGPQVLGGPKMQGGRRRKSHMLKKMSQARDQRKAEVKDLCRQTSGLRARGYKPEFPPQNYLNGK